MIFNIPTLILMMQEFLRENYEKGGHWLYETWDMSDYEAFLLDNVFTTEDEIKNLLRVNWEATNAQSRECAWGAPDESPC